ncbi:MAG TPA: sensor domain-containing protein [Solirubrobacteraceae bacterium]|jgi:signal transduction histidine kinase
MTPKTTWTRSLRTALAQAARDTAYLTVGTLTSALALAVWITGVTLTLSLVVFVVGLPIVIASAVAFRWTAELDRRNAAWLLGRPVRGVYRGAGHGLRARLRATLCDPQSARDLVWLVLHSMLGFTLGCIGVGMVVFVAGLVTLPAWYWSLPNGRVDFGLWHADSTAKAFLGVLLALPTAFVTVGVLRVCARAESWLAVRLLDGDDAGVSPSVDSPTDAPPRRRRFDPEIAFSLHGAVTAFVAVLMAVIWVGVGLGYFWPAWVWLGIAAPLGIHVVIRRAVRAPAVRGRSVRVHAEASALIVGYLTLVWAMSGGGTFWPFWAALGLSVPLGLHALVVYRDRLNPTREQELTERVDVLTRTRQGALDVQAAELRRIERDLHDGAQARLVSLSMLVGRAEEQLADRPEVAALVRRAREEAGAAIGELRDLARGIAPPVLTDRGLNAAVQALGVRAPMAVTVDVFDEGRPPPVVETAAYFVVAEALTNVAKHAGGAPARVVVTRDASRLVVEVSDDGPGGADPAGSGLKGLVSRVEAIDGTLRVTSPAGGPTTIRAELPCGS